MADLATYRPKRVLRTPSHLVQNDAHNGVRRVAKEGIYNTKSGLKQCDLQSEKS